MNRESPAAGCPGINVYCEGENEPSVEHCPRCYPDAHGTALAAALQSAKGWEEDAKRYAINTAHWRNRAHASEANFATEHAALESAEAKLAAALDALKYRDAHVADAEAKLAAVRTLAKRWNRQYGLQSLAHELRAAFSAPTDARGDRLTPDQRGKVELIRNAAESEGYLYLLAILDAHCPRPS